MSAWSETPYTTGSITLAVENESGRTTDPNTGISVVGTTEKHTWRIGGNYDLAVDVPKDYVITGVSFKYFEYIEDIVFESCYELVWNA